MMNDGVAGIVTGRQPMSDWDQLVSDWRTKGGDQIRDEFQKALGQRSAF
jgi:putative aldouronate transport system substrate-binding protein